MQKFTVHWFRIPRGASEGFELFALWPSPMTADECFRYAGFTDFGDGDEQWEVHAGELLSRLLREVAFFNGLLTTIIRTCFIGACCMFDLPLFYYILPGDQHDSEASFVSHHACVSFSGLCQRNGFDHRSNPLQGTKG